ncbi:MAG: winged helix-turn-helix transcriptional regulator [Proteobacteria bacterium]|nr:winged helix-turn-helix transcriptional regulator [Pseudomonadota bacterium]
MSSMSAPHEKTKATPLSPGQTAVLADMFRLMGDASRLRIVLACLDAPVAVSDIAARLGLSASLVSHHLRLLRAGRILKATRKGKQVFYTAADAHISRVVADMVAHAGETLHDTDIP